MTKRKSANNAMTAAELIDAIQNGKKVVCSNFDQCREVLQFLKDEGFKIQNLLSWIIDGEEQPEKYLDDWTCPGLSQYNDNIVCYRYSAYQDSNSDIDYERCAGLFPAAIDSAGLGDGLAELFNDM